MPRGLVEIAPEVLRAERERAGLSLGDVSRRTGIAEAMLHRLERPPAKQLRPSTIRKLARILGVAPERLGKTA